MPLENILLFAIVMIYGKTKLDQQLKFMRNLNIDFSFTAYEIINNKESIIGFREAK